MAKQYSRAGKSTHEMASKRRTVIFGIGIVGIVAVIILGVVIQNAQALGIGGFVLLFLFMFLAQIPKITDRFMAQKQREAKRAYRGAKAEEAVEEILNGLDGENYETYHDISSPYGNIDHVVVSRQKGIFLLETKSHGGKVEIVDSGLLVNGKAAEKDFIAQTLKNTYWLRDCLQASTAMKVWIKPVIVFTNAFVVPGKPIKNLAVINGKYLLRYIQQQPGHPANETVWAARDKIAQALYSE
jgi:Nuclease-related domain